MPHRLKVVIIGNGIAGITAARHIRKLSDYSITVISSESKYFFSRTALMYVYMGHMRHRDIEPYETWFWEKNRIDLVQDHVLTIDYNEKKITTSNGQPLHYDKLIIACGSSSNMLDIPGKEAKGVKALYSLQDLEYIDSISGNMKKAVIVGGGLIGIELAEMFHSRKIPVTFLIRENAFWDVVLPGEEAQIVSDHIIEHGIDLQSICELKELSMDMDGKVNAVITREGKVFPCDFVGVTIGVHPNVDWLKGGPLEINDGILVDEYLKTNMQDVFAIGDCAELKNPPEGRKPIEAIWYSGRMMGECVAYSVCNNETLYKPGLWFNSAKFFDIEYQVYGDIQAKLPSNQKSLFWKHQDGKKSVRINYREDGLVLGFNLLGVRFRQEVCEKWINEKYGIEDVLSKLEIAVFDPEFSENYCHEIRMQYQNDTGIGINSKHKRNYDLVFRFLQQSKMKTS